jgi:DNA-directed RNA polymerase alpha subunit
MGTKEVARAVNELAEKIGTERGKSLLRDKLLKIREHALAIVELTENLSANKHAIEGLLDMSIEEYLTRERFSAAGVKLKVNYPRAFNGLLNSRFKGSSQKIFTVRDLVGLSEESLLRLKNLGKKTISAIKTVLEHDGLKLA